MPRIDDPLNDQARTKLGQDLPADAIRTRPQAGQTLSYVESASVIKRLNEVFGHDGWDITYDAPVVVAGDRPMIYVAARLRAAGVTRGDVGVGLAASAKPDAFETAIKAAYTDGLKRAARTFGASLGLALYDKSQADVGAGFAAQTLISSLADCTDLAAWNDAHRAELEVLDESDKAAVRAAYAARQRALRPATPAAASFAPARPIAETAEAEFKAATSAASLEAAVSRHAKALAALAEQDRLYLRNVIRTRREELARFDLAAQIEADAGRATTSAAAQAVYERLTAAAKAGKITQAQAESITETLNERLALASAA